MIAKFSSVGKEYTLDTNVYDLFSLKDGCSRVYTLCGEGYKQNIRVKDLNELKEKLKRNGFVFEGFVVEGNVQ